MIVFSVITYLYTSKCPGEKTRLRTTDPPEDDDPRLECGNENIGVKGSLKRVDEMKDAYTQPDRRLDIYCLLCYIGYPSSPSLAINLWGKIPRIGSTLHPWIVVFWWIGRTKNSIEPTSKPYYQAANLVPGETFKQNIRYQVDVVTGGLKGVCPIAAYAQLHFRLLSASSGGSLTRPIPLYLFDALMDE
ncbi:hypothetical protein CDAR_512361 [Caerostris darwini]|uniref:Uncharacterized protein n=1 Tax=Caerostris darwini TaxID=1538125 RepID=A0AAV4WHF1_9ARAC|nr:hypothetical protein CDAR_512361 [Caerostris darwini]